MAEIRLVMTAEPAPVPSLPQLLPPSSVAHSPALATPAITIFEHGLAETRPRFPHSDGMFARLPVAFTHWDGGASTTGGDERHSKERLAPPAPEPAVPEPPAPDPAAPPDPPPPEPPVCVEPPP